MSNQVNTLEILDNGHELTLERVRLDENGTALSLFTQNSERTAVQFCEEPEIKDYMLCRGSDYILCRIGRRPEERLLLSVGGRIRAPP